MIKRIIRNPFQGCLFLLQSILAFWFVIGQSFKFFNSTVGVSPSMFLSFWLSMALNYRLTSTEKSTDKTSDSYKFLVDTYKLWMISLGLLLVMLVFLGRLQGLDIHNELRIISGVGLGSFGILFLSKSLGYSLRNPYVKGLISGVMKAFPQAMLIPIAHNVGIEGWEQSTIWIGTITITIRIVMTLYEIYKQYQINSDKVVSFGDKVGHGNIAVLLAEGANLTSWGAFIYTYYQILLH